METIRLQKKNIVFDYVLALMPRQTIPNESLLLLVERSELWIPCGASPCASHPYPSPLSPDWEKPGGVTPEHGIGQEAAFGEHGSHTKEPSAERQSYTSVETI